jgi:dTDP-glucose 4,6-dehydratase
VYGSIPSGAFRETDPIQPSSPYSASKAGGDLQALAIHHTFGYDIVITRGSNTYGPRQYPEKLVPLFITNALDGLPLPVYGDGLQVRDWIHVRDHAEGIWFAMEHGEAGQVYNVGGGNEWPNLEITRRILAHTGASDDLITYVEDRPGHDRRYALDTAKMRALGWAPQVDFDEGLASTVEWYRDGRPWWEPIKSGEYAEWYARNYASR